MVAIAATAADLLSAGVPSPSRAGRATGSASESEFEATMAAELRAHPRTRDDHRARTGDALPASGKGSPPATATADLDDGSTAQPGDPLAESPTPGAPTDAASGRVSDVEPLHGVSDGDFAASAADTDACLSTTADAGLSPQVDDAANSRALPLDAAAAVDASSAEPAIVDGALPDGVAHASAGPIPTSLGSVALMENAAMSTATCSSGAAADDALVRSRHSVANLTVLTGPQLRAGEVDDPVALAETNLSPPELGAVDANSLDSLVDDATGVVRGGDPAANSAAARAAALDATLVGQGGSAASAASTGSASTVAHNAAAAVAAGTDSANAPGARVGTSLSALFSQLGSDDAPEAISQRVLWMNQQGLQFARIHVNPSDLGPIDINLDQRDGAVSVSMTAHHPLTRDLLESHMPRMRELLRSEGTELAQFDLHGGDGGRSFDERTDRQPIGAAARADNEVAGSDVLTAVHRSSSPLGLFEAYA